MEIVYKRVDDLIEYEGNARRNDAGVAKVAESIREFGFLNPITIDPNNVIIAGHTRLKAAKQLGMEEVPCIVQNLSEEDAKLARIIDNKSHEYSTWDVGKLHQELSGIGLDFKTTFFTPNRDRKFFKDNKFLIVQHKCTCQHVAGRSQHSQRHEQSWRLAGQRRQNQYQCG